MTAEGVFVDYHGVKNKQAFSCSFNNNIALAQEQIHDMRAACHTCMSTLWGTARSDTDTYMYVPGVQHECSRKTATAHLNPSPTAPPLLHPLLATLPLPAAPYHDKEPAFVRRVAFWCFFTRTHVVSPFNWSTEIANEINGINAMAKHVISLQLVQYNSLKTETRLS